MKTIYERRLENDRRILTDAIEVHYQALGRLNVYKSPTVEACRKALRANIHTLRRSLLNCHQGIPLDQLTQPTTKFKSSREIRI